jgi:hypothetical protein
MLNVPLLNPYKLSVGMFVTGSGMSGQTLAGWNHRLYSNRASGMLFTA